MVKKIAIASLLAASLIGTNYSETSMAAQTSPPRKKPPVAQPASQLILVNVQLVELDAANTLLRVQSSGPQAFDRLKSKNPRQVLLRLHRAQLGDLPAFDQPSFGSIVLSQESAGNVLLTIDLASSMYTATVAQGGNPNTVEVRIQH